MLFHAYHLGGFKAEVEAVSREQAEDTMVRLLGESERPLILVATVKHSLENTTE